MKLRKLLPKIVLRVGLATIMLLSLVPFEQATEVVAAPLAATPTTSTLKIKVVSARTEPRFKNGTNGGVTKGATVTNYKFIINKDNAGDPNQARSPKCSPSTNTNYPDGCNWPSIHTIEGSAPVVTQGDNTDLDANKGLNLPNGKYLISILADGYKIDGAHFTIPLQAPGLVEVPVQPFPLPLGTVQLQVFEDIGQTNGQFDIPDEHGLAGFQGHLSDVLGEVTNDWFGNPICTTYLKQNGQIILDPATGKPTIDVVGGKCLSGTDGVVKIENLGPNRYTATVVPPNGQTWIQTTTLEGNHDYDVWTQEGATGFDTETIGPGAEKVPSIPFGYVKPTQLPAGSNGKITGSMIGVKIYVPPTGGLVFNGTNGDASGTKLDKPIARPWVALTDLNRGDAMVYAGLGKTDGSGAFQIDNVPDGDYSLTLWDQDQDYLLETLNVTVANGQTTNVGVREMAGWWTVYEGKVCIDQNNNGKCDPGEPGIPNQDVVLKTRANSVQERGIATAKTDLTGHYIFREAYPLSSWLVMEYYNQRFKTSGVTFQADNQPTETTLLGSGVDVSVFPVIGLSGRLDWAVKPYAAGTNGGIVGTVTYDTTRNETDARFSVTEAYQPGIPGLNVNLYAPAKDRNGNYIINADGSYRKGRLLNQYKTENWNRPTNCTARDISGKPFPQSVLPPATGDHDCLESPMMGVQFQADFSTVNGNYGFTTVWQYDSDGELVVDNNEKPVEVDMPAGDYLVEVQIPKDNTALHHPLYQVTKEEDVNVFTGDTFTPQQPPPPCAGANHTVHVTNPDFLAIGGSPFEGQQKPLCNMKLVTVQNGSSIAPNFNLFTPVPLPGRFWGLINDDLNLSTSPQDILFGEKRGLANVPVGLYDFTNRHVLTVDSDPNGFFEVLMPSTSSYNCPLPAGPCPSVYRMVGNDPGQPNALNFNYNPQYRTISASFEMWPGLIIPADLAPVLNGSVVQNPNTTPAQQNQAVTCALATNTPQIFAVSKPYAKTSDNLATRTITISGTGFGASQGTGQVKLGSTILTVVPGSWKDGEIKVIVPPTLAAGTHQLEVTAGNKQVTTNGLTFHMLGTGYDPTVYEVGPGRTYSTIQSAVEAGSNMAQALVVVYPGQGRIPINLDGTGTYNANGAYFENVVLHSPIKLQGVGPGGIRSDKTTVNGSIIDGLGFGDETYADNWRTFVSGLHWSGNQTIYEGSVITVLAQSTGPTAFGAAYKGAIDGFAITGGEQLGTPNKVNSLPGGVVSTQGGGIFVNAFARNLQITNNILRSNGGSYGGAIRLGTPFVPDNQNDSVRVSNNRILANGGTNLAGGIGIFNGANGYSIDNNDICGNYSAEYGGGISHSGYSPNGSIHHNRIYFNTSYDEGAGIMIAGELPANTDTLSKGSGPVNIYNNYIEANLANDDGGGIRLLMAGNYPINIYNNMITNNVSTHEGGAIALDDAPAVSIYNNTIMKNITTATAATSNGQPAPAGISTAANSTLLQATIPGSALFSDPILFNNILWDNRAGKWDGINYKLTGIGLSGDATPINYWDLGVADNTGLLSPTNSVLKQSGGYNASSTNKVGADPRVRSLYNTSVAVFPWRTNPTFASATIVALELPANLLGDYHLATTGSPAYNAGATSKTSVNAPKTDIDGDVRKNGPDIGADEFK